MNTASHEDHLRQALRVAQEAALNNEIPVGCVLVLKTGEVFESINAVESTGDPTAHAERLVLEMAGRKLGRRALEESTLYCTLEPCAMCAGALVAARVGTLVFSTRDERFGACRSIYRIADDPRSNHRLVVIEGILENEARNLLQEFFKQRRLHF